VKRFALILGACLEGAAVQFASLIPALIGFHLFAKFFYGGRASLLGCAIASAIVAALWSWILARADEPVLRTIGTLLISTTLWFFFFVGVLLVYLLFKRHSPLTAMEIILLLVCIVPVFFYVVC
jgi:hypothetical protein